MTNEGSADALKVTETKEGVIFTVHVQPRASRNELCGVQGDGIKVRLTSPPVEGAANSLCVEFLAGLLGVAKSRVTIMAGERSRHKTVRVEGITKEELLTLLR